MIISRKKFEEIKDKIKEEVATKYINKYEEILQAIPQYGDEQIANTITELKEDLEEKDKEIIKLSKLIKELRFKNKELLETIAYYREKMFRDGG